MLVKEWFYLEFRMATRTDIVVMLPDFLWYIALALTASSIALSKPVFYTAVFWIL